MTHFYISKIYASRRGSGEYDQVKLICTREYVDQAPGLLPVAVTVPTSVTCPKCLEILIPVQEKRLDLMRKNFLTATQVVGGTQ